MGTRRKTSPAHKREDRPRERIALVVSDGHAIHHIRSRGYVETPARIGTIRDALEPSGLFTLRQPRAFADEHLTAVHDAELVNFLRRACARMPAGKTLYPYIFPIRNRTRLPEDPTVLPSYYCIDTFTPVHRDAYPAARRAVDCALTAADEILAGRRRRAYALVRPPGHHAERRLFGGFCYFNNTAIAAHYLSAHGRVAILDLDYHHGNGQQDIFYRRADVLTLSIHGHPKFAYPYFTGFEEERGDGPGEGFNWNLPLPESVDGPAYTQALAKAIERIQAFHPQFLVVALGLDTAGHDPAGSWRLQADDFEVNGRMLGALGLPTLVVQEGGYRLRTLGRNALSFFRGVVQAELHTNARAAAAVDPETEEAPALQWRCTLRPEDPEAIRHLVDLTGFFNPEEIGVAEELALERLAKGEASGYYFVMAELDGRLVGYSCYGPIAGSANSFDLYWIAVHPDIQRRGLGRRLMQESERLIYNAGGRRIYVETSGRAIYASTRIFYEYCAYRREAILEDFYAPGDGKVVYCKVLA
jgi:acetoin utilization deacetylase AcuC-like enzyme/GNAT superfamily N-acetyltransferase